MERDDNLHPTLHHFLMEYPNDQIVSCMYCICILTTVLMLMDLLTVITNWLLKQKLLDFHFQKSLFSSLSENEILDSEYY